MTFPLLLLLFLHLGSAGIDLFEARGLVALDTAVRSEAFVAFSRRISRDLWVPIPLLWSMGSVVSCVTTKIMWSTTFSQSVLTEQPVAKQVINASV